ncbi:protein kinase [Streptomyces sp. 21So2-11]|uniref:protein kinase domain-containing protein n=1 Tax=Streptomyces sp. 21So2-11 TaxID=3144408 RepID=UPI00321C1891
MYDLTEGTELGAGRYRLQTELGAGGTARVYRAHDDALDRTVAVKVMHPELARDPAFRQRFRREARLAAGLNHPHVVAVHDIGEQREPGGQEPLLYLVMEFVEGESLLDRLGRGPLPTADALRCAGDMLEGLGASHGQGIVHRGVKPANVMITTGGWCKVLGVGIARPGDGSPGPGAARVTGCTSYLAPEQVNGGATDGRTDVYAVGVVLFELLSGRTPFGEAAVRTSADAPPREAAPTLAEVGVRVPRSVQEVITRALAADPRDRFADAYRMTVAIDRILERGGLRTQSVTADVQRRVDAGVPGPLPVAPGAPVRRGRIAASSRPAATAPGPYPPQPHGRRASRFAFWAGLAGFPLLFAALYNLAEQGVAKPPVVAVALTAAAVAIVGLVCAARVLARAGCGPACRHGMAGWGVFLNLVAALVWFAWLLGMASPG